jgi:hypothetical protein
MFEFINADAVKSSVALHGLLTDDLEPSFSLLKHRLPWWLSSFGPAGGKHLASTYTQG